MPLVIMIGMNIMPDGRIVTVTMDGTVIAPKPDLSEGYYYNLPGEQIWNSIPIDDHAGIPPMAYRNFNGTAASKDLR